MEIDGSCVLVTGAGSGIGRATAMAFAQAGANVVVTDRDDEGGPETLRLLQASGGSGIFTRMDVTDPEAIRAAVELARDTYGGLHFAVNNAGWEGVTAPIQDQSRKDFDKVIQVNLTGVWNCLKEELAAMEEGAAIVNVSSVAGIIGFAGSAGYVASKHGVIGLTRTANLEAAPQGIRINAVLPGVIETPMVDRAFAKNPGMREAIVPLHPIGRTGRPEEVAEAILWLCSPKASFITGVSLAVDGGWTGH